MPKTEPAPEQAAGPGSGAWSGQRLGLGFGLVVLVLVTGWYFSSGEAEGRRPVFRSLPLDDAYIHMVYARSLGSRARFEYNEGVPEAGMTSLLWVILESPFVTAARLLALSPVVAVHLLNQLVVLLLAISVLAWTRHVFSCLALGCLAGLAVLLEPALGFSRFAGMEVLTSSCLMVAAYFQWDRERYPWAGFLFALAILARPENVLLLSLCLMVELRGPKLRPWLWLLVPALVGCGLWAWLNFSATGRPLPNTFYAKGRLALDLSETGMLIRHMVFKLPYFQWLAGFLLYVMGCGLMLRQRKLRALPAVLFPWLFVLSLASSRNFVCLWAYVFHRYFQPCIPFLLIPWLAGAWFSVRELIRAFGEGSKLSPRKLLLGGAGLLLVLVSLVPWPRQTAYWRELLAWNCSNIEDIQVRIGHWVASNTLSSDIIAVKDAGAIRFYGQRQTLDMDGLNSHEVLSDPVGTVLRVRPAYIVMPAQPGDPDPYSQMWHESRLGKKGRVWLRPVFTTRAERYTITEGYPNRQTVYEISYQQP